MTSRTLAGPLSLNIFCRARQRRRVEFCVGRGRQPAGVMAALQQNDSERSNAAVMHPSAENLSIHVCISSCF